MPKHFAGPISFVIFLLTVCGGGGALAQNATAVIDDGDPGFSLTQTTGWFKVTGRGLNSDYTMGKGAGKAIWAFSVSTGSYRVSITWYNAGYPYNKSFSPAAPVSITSGATLLASTNVCLTNTPSDRIDLGVGWKDLGIFNVTSPSIQVAMSAVTNLYVIADAIRIERIDGTAIPVPKISSVAPMNCPLLGGIPVSILGTQFVSGSRVFFGSNLSPQVTFYSSNSIVAVAPTNAAGVYDVTVISPQGLSGALGPKFRYAIARTLDDGEVGFLATAPATTAVGSGFQGDFVYPGGTYRASTASWATPVRPLRTQKLAVTWYNAGAPYNTIFATNVSFQVMDGTNILGVVPANLQTTPNDFIDQGFGWRLLGNFAFASGMAKVALVNNTDSRLMADAIRIEELFPAPVLSSVALTVGLPGETAVLLSGSQFLPGATVMLGNVAAASVSYVNGNSLKVSAPSLLIGTDVIVVTNPDGQKSTGLSFTF